MRLDEPEGEVQIAFYKPPVEQDPGAGTGRAQVGMRGRVAGVVGRDCIATQDFRPDNFLQLLRGGGPVQPGGDEKGDTSRRHAGLFESVQHVRQHHAVGRGPRNVANGNRSSSFAPRHIEQGRSPQRMTQRFGERVIRRCHRFSKLCFQHRRPHMRRQGDCRTLATKGKLDFHDRPELLI